MNLNIVNVKYAKYVLFLLLVWPGMKPVYAMDVYVVLVHPTLHLGIRNDVPDSCYGVRELLHSGW